MPPSRLMTVVSHKTKFKKALSYLNSCAVMKSYKKLRVQNMAFNKKMTK